MVLLPLISLLPLIAGCGPGPFTRAADAYAEANAASAQEIASAPTTAFRVCRKKARVSYLQQRLGILSTPEDIPWNKWYATAKATDKQSWEQYCAEVATTGKVFSVALGALRQYGVALKSLVEGGKYDGADIQKAAEGAGKIAASLENERVAGATKPIGNLVAQLATFLLADVTEDRIADYVRRADPLVAPLVTGLSQYVDAVDAELRAAENTQRQTLLALEVRGGLSEPGADPDKLLIFYGFALDTENDMQDTRTILECYKGVLARLKTAHGAMVKAGAQGNDVDIKKAMGAVFDLLSQVQALHAALSKE